MASLPDVVTVTQPAPPPFDTGNAILGEQPAQLVTALIQTPAGQRLALTIRTPSRTQQIRRDKEKKLKFAKMILAGPGAMLVAVTIAVVCLAAFGSPAPHHTGSIQRADCISTYEAQVNGIVPPDAISGHWISNGCGEQGRVHGVCSDITGATTLINGGWVVKNKLNDAAGCPAGYQALARAAWEVRAGVGYPDLYCWFYDNGHTISPPDCDG